MTVHLIPFGVMAVGVVLLLVFASAWMTANPEDVPVANHEHQWGYWGSEKTYPHDPMPSDGPLWQDCRWCPAVRPPEVER